MTWLLIFQNVNHSKLRVDIRFYCELINNGIFTHKESLPLLGNVLTCLINNDKEDHNNIAIILSFCRHCGLEYAGKSKDCFFFFFILII